MSILRCRKCGALWNAEQRPLCPVCLVSQWESQANLVRPKHHPDTPRTWATAYCSVLGRHVITNMREFLECAAEDGTFFWHKRHKKYCHLTWRPMATMAGAAIEPGEDAPQEPLDCLLMADAMGDAHPYCIDRNRFIEEDVGQQVAIPLPRCRVDDCSNLATPYGKECALHCSPQLADIAEWRAA